MDNLKSKEWWKAAGIRCLKTFAQTLISTIGVTTFMHEVDWKLVLSASTLAAILSIATSFAGLPEVKNEIKEDENANGY